MASTVKTRSRAAEALAQNVRERREALGLNQEQLARAAKIDSADVSRIENAQMGSRGIGLAKLERLAVALRCPMAALLHA